jgi:hypothetical protein
MKYTFGVFLAAALGILTIFSPLFAHHGSSVSYDLANRLTFKGTVTEFVWSNPHSQIYFDVKDEKGQIAHWGGEMNSPAVLSRSGWTRHSLQPGDQITITIAPTKAPGTHVGLVGRVVLANGQALEANQVLKPGTSGAE